jgi:hypothetical protein
MANPDFLVGENRGVNPRGVPYDRKINDQMESLKSVGQFAWESLPGIGTYYTIEDIKEELAKENPNYYAIGALAGAEVIGLIPGLGDAAAELIKKGARSAGKLGSKIDRAVDQTTALLGGPKAKDVVKNEMAGFTGQNPPTYIPKDEPPFDPDGIYKKEDDIVRFREPIAEFTRKLTMTNSFPSKGMTGAEFLRLLEKNAESIPPSSYKEGLIDRDKRYTREQLLDAVTKSPRGLPESIYYNLADLNANPAYQGYQRQSEVGFTGAPTVSNSYFSIPILSRTSGNTFKANSQHFDPSTTAHVRGSFVDSMVGYDVNKTLSPRFKSIIGREDKYLLVEEIQSDLLQKGYRKPKNSFDTAFDKAANEAMVGSQVTFQEMYGDVTNELKSLIKTLEAKDIVMPEEPVRLQLPFRTGVLNHPVYKERRRRDFLDELRAPERGVVDGSNLVDFEEIKDYIDEQGVNSSHIYQILNDIELSASATRSFNPFESVSFVGPNGKVYNDIIVRSQDSNVAPYTIDQDSPAYSQFLTDFEDYTKQFGLSYEDLLDKYEDEITKYYDAVGVEIEAKNLDTDLDRSFISSMYERFLEIKKDQKLLGDETNTALPPVRKNRQTVEEALKLLIAKADQEGVDKIVIPPAERIALARGRTIEPDDKGDRFYRTYVTDLDKALKDLEKNYPVTIHRDVELPYKNINQPNRTAAAQHLIDMGFGDMVNDNPNAFADVDLEGFMPDILADDDVAAANAADIAAINDDDINLDDIDEIFNDEEPFFNITEDGELTPEDQALQNLLAGDADAEITPEVANQIDQMMANMLQDPTEEIVEETLKDSPKEPSKLGTIIDISKLREQFQVDKPRQFAEGGSVRPKLRPGSDRRISPKPRLRPDPERQYGLADVEFRADMDPILSKDPIARLGFDLSRARYDVAEGVENAAYLPSNAKEPVTLNNGTVVHPDTVVYGPDMGSSKSVIAHEFRHRGFDLLHEMFEQDPDDFIKKYGKEAVELLYSNPEFQTELFDVVDEKINLPGDRGTVTSDKYLDYIDKKDVEHFREKGYFNEVIPEVQIGILSKDTLNKGIVGLRFAAEDALKKAGEPTGFVDMSTGPKTRSSRKYKPNVWQRIKKKFFAEGGTVDMNQQMSFAFEDGGLRDDGMRQDPVSGNEVPSGSMASEVRDDIPAQLSEGEYVVPADVVRYYGVKFFEDLRDNAKMGLQDMESRGRIGGEPVPAGGPTNNDDLSAEELSAIKQMVGMNIGGFVDTPMYNEDPYAQQQSQYTVPMQMNKGGPVRGYEPGGDVTAQNDVSSKTMEDYFLRAANLTGQNKWMMPLGSTIFPDANTGKTIFQPTQQTAETLIYLYGPNGEVRSFTSPLSDADKKIYEDLIAQGYTTEKPETLFEPEQMGSGGDDDKRPPKETETDPTGWMDKFDYTDSKKLAEQTLNSLTPAMGGITGGLSKIGAIGTFANGTKSAQAAANIILLDSQGYDTTSLKQALQTFNRQTGVGSLPNFMINGDSFARAASLKSGILLGQDAVDIFGKPIFKDETDYQKFRTQWKEVAPFKAVQNANLQELSTQENQVKTAEAIQKKEDDQKTALEILEAAQKSAESGTTANIVRTSGEEGSPNREQTEQNLADVLSGLETGAKTGTIQLNQGGLMTTPKPKKKRGRPRKSGLAGKK